MPAHKVPPMKKKIVFGVAIKREVVIAFENKCKELGINKSNLIESLMEEFIK